jgi:hypothetical protein
MSRRPGRWAAWTVAALLACAGPGGTAPAWAAPEQTDLEMQYLEAFDRGLEAFRQGDLKEASRAFQEAYLIRPTDKKLQSWMAIVRDEQARREAMTYALEDAESRPATPPPAAPVESYDGYEYEQEQDPIWKRLQLPEPTPAGDGGSDERRSSRPEILEAGKRAGFEKLYKEGIGFQPIPGFGVSGRVEIYEEPNPVESLVLDAKVLNFSEISQYRNSITPLFVRSGATRFVADYEPLPRFTYEYDARETLHQFQTRFGFKDIDIQTHAFQALYSLPPVPLLGTLTFNPWYKRVLQSSDADVGSYHHRDQVILNFSLQQTPNIEYFFQADAYDSDNTRTLGGSKNKLFKGQLRLRFPRLKLFVIPSAEYSDTDFDPSDDEFKKRDFFVDWGFDITKRLRAASKQQIIMTELSAPTATPSNPDTRVFNTFNKLSYEIIDDVDVSVGLDYSKNAGMNEFDNYGLRLETELFKPGIIRSRVGFEWHNYYNIDEDLSLLYWRFFLFQ